MARTANAAAIAVASVGTTLLSLSRILVPSGSVTVGASTAATTLALETLSFKLTGSKCLAVSRSCWGLMGCGSLIILGIFYTACASDAASVCAPIVPPLSPPPLPRPIALLC